MQSFESADMDSLVAFATELASLFEAPGRPDLAALSQALCMRALERSVGDPLDEEEAALFLSISDLLSLHCDAPSSESAMMIAELISDPAWKAPWFPLDSEEQASLLESFASLPSEALPSDALPVSEPDGVSAPAAPVFPEISLPIENLALISPPAEGESPSCPMGADWRSESAPIDSDPRHILFPSDSPCETPGEVLCFSAPDTEGLVSFAMQIADLAESSERSDMRALSEALGLRALERSLGEPLSEEEEMLFVALADACRSLWAHPDPETLESIALIIGAPSWGAPWAPLSDSEAAALLSSMAENSSASLEEASEAQADAIGSGSLGAEIPSDGALSSPSFGAALESIFDVAFDSVFEPGESIPSDSFAVAPAFSERDIPEMDLSGIDSAVSIDSIDLSGMAIGDEIGFIEGDSEIQAAVSAPAPEYPWGFPEPASASFEPQRIERSAHKILQEESDHLFSSIHERSELLASADEISLMEGFPDFAEEVTVVAGASEAAGFSYLPLLVQEILGSALENPSACPTLLPGFARDLPAYLFAPSEETARALSQWAPSPEESFAALFPVEYWDLQAEAADFDVSEEEASLSVPEDVNNELLDGLLAEIPIQTSHLTDALRRIVDRTGSQADLELAKRAAHTLKGAANTVGVRAMASLTHRMEDILLPLSERGLFPDQATGEILSRAADLLESMGEFLLGQGLAPDSILDGLREVAAHAAKVAIDGVESIAGEPAPMAAAESDASAEAQIVAHVRIPATLVDEMLRMVGESMTSSSRLSNLVDIAQQEQIRFGMRSDALQSLAIDLERQIDAQSRRETFLSAEAPEGFDELEFERAGEVQTLMRRLLEMAADFRDAHNRSTESLRLLQASVEGQARLHEAHQETVLRSRLAQVGSVVPRLQRGLRQVARLLDKEARLVVSGEKVLLDGHILQSLADALMHAIRNSIDHGLEDRETRLAAGKPSEGLLRLSFSSEGGFALARLSDDGGGFDTDRILSKARSMGLVGPDETLSSEEIHQLVFHSGFSTKDGVSQVSGRGVGMDAVRAMVESAQGTISIHSERGKGAVLIIRIPSTLLSMSVLMLRCGGKRFALSNRGVRDLKFLEPEKIVVQNGRKVVVEGGRSIPVVSLESILGFPPADESEAASLIYIRDDRGQTSAIVAERIAEAQTLVVNKLSDFLPPIPGVIGSAISGDGSVSSILDLVALMEASGSETSARKSSSASARETGSGKSKRLPVLVVDDSVSARRATVRVLAQAGWPVVEALDGLEAVRLLAKTPVCAVVTDMEMPRMSGIDLARHIRAQSALSALPVVMITSRSTEKHRKEAQSAGVDHYLVKPFDETRLLEIVGDMVAERSSPSAPELPE